jgi:hypothetical protein
VTTPTVLAAPLLGHVEGVELVETGTWAAASGPFSPTPGDLAAAAAAVDCPAVRRPVLKAGHDGQHGVGEPALGYVANLRTANEGQTLVGDYRGMPAWLTEVDADGHSALASAYPDRSIEGEYAYRCQLGHTHPFVVHAVSLLGVERPAVGTLESLQELYGVVAATAATDLGRLISARTYQGHFVQPYVDQEGLVPQEITAAATTDDVRRAYYSGPGTGWAWWIREMYVDPPELIVDNDDDATIWRVPYAIADDGTVTFADAQQVRVEYVTARVSAGEPLQRFATRTESRAGQPGDSAPQTSTATAAEPAAAGGTTPLPEEPMSGTSLLDGLRQQLGLAADADEATVLAANAEALAERADAPPADTTSTAGVVQVDATTLDELRRQAAAGAAAREQQEVEHRTRMVDAAVSDGRIAPARRDHWIAQLSADPGAEAVLASLEKGTVPLSPVGHDGDAPTVVTAEVVRETPAYKNWSM